MIKVKFKYCIWFSIPNMDKKKFYTTQPSFDQKLSLYQKYKNDHAFKNWLVKLMYFMNDFNNDILPYWTVQIEHQLQWIYHLQVFVRYKSWYIDERWTATMYVPYCMLFTDRTSQFSSNRAVNYSNVVNYIIFYRYWLYIHYIIYIIAHLNFQIPAQISTGEKNLIL